MDRKHILMLAALTTIVVGGTALAAHAPEVDPATVPVGMLAGHKVIEDVPASSLARAVTPDGTEITIQHVRLGKNGATPWHTHPGPGIVSIVAGELTYEDAKANRCRRQTFGAGEGFVDRGFGHVHRAIAGTDGVDFYVVFVMPRGTANPTIPTDPLSECVG